MKWKETLLGMILGGLKWMFVEFYKEQKTKRRRNKLAKQTAKWYGEIHREIREVVTSGIDTTEDNTWATICTDLENIIFKRIITSDMYKLRTELLFNLPDFDQKFKEIPKDTMGYDDPFDYIPPLDFSPFDNLTKELKEYAQEIEKWLSKINRNNAYSHMKYDTAKTIVVYYEFMANRYNLNKFLRTLEIVDLNKIDFLLELASLLIERYKKESPPNFDPSKIS